MMHLVAGAGVEPAAFGLWARYASAAHPCVLKRLYPRRKGYDWLRNNPLGGIPYYLEGTIPWQEDRKKKLKNYTTT